MSEQRSNSVPNRIHTPLHSNCRLCHSAGFSNLCTYAQGGDCPYMTLKRTLAKEITKNS
jgi:hypothetical protein